ncbi:MotE family protein [Geminicoccus flavidas]|uniref:MotE family protein n=1 Tax=Geminicoccus flavidas TaxID=2506407 RepID=UPI001358A041|nr:hypothetical protein [Geminicoccus flavidas]
MMRRRAGPAIAAPDQARAGRTFRQVYGSSALRLALLLPLGLLAAGLWLAQDLLAERSAARLDGTGLVDVEPAAGSGLPDAERMPDLLAAAAGEIEAQRSELSRRERDLAAREAALHDLAEKLRVEVATLQALRQEQDDAAERAEAEQEERAARLARLYETMKPKRAASILDHVPVEEVAAIARRMRDGKAALIIQQMSPERASALSARLALP